ncbi:hypothetical protein C8R43DRAFT_1139197 [Mycena crocata]|nr:hypothetical protein C8R43DRAFT_1139197 [Mycena crocata]
MSPPSPTTQFDRVSAGFRPTMRAPFVTSELKAVSKAERQAKLDHLQQLRAQAKAKKRPPVKIPVPGLPFPTSPPIIPTPPAPPTPSPPKTPSKTPWPPPEEPPIFDCRRCRRELFPRSFCRCGTATQCAAARKIADDAWFKEDPNGWFEYHAPPRRYLPTDAQLDAELQAAADEAQREHVELEIERTLRKARRDAVRAPYRLAVAEAASIGAERVLGAERSLARDQWYKMERLPMALVVKQLDALRRAKSAAVRDVLKGQFRLAAAEAARSQRAKPAYLLSPPGKGFRYVEQGGAMWLALENGVNTSLMYIGDAHIAGNKENDLPFMEGLGIPSSYVMGAADAVSLKLKREALVEGKTPTGFQALDDWMDPCVMSKEKLAARDKNRAGYVPGSWEKRWRAECALRKARLDYVNELCRKGEERHTKAYLRLLRYRPPTAEVPGAWAAERERRKEKLREDKEKLEEEKRRVAARLLADEAVHNLFILRGQPLTPFTGQKLYLVTGSQVDRPGAYVSWPSADFQYKKVSGATLKGYTVWDVLQSAWFAACDRGEHSHPARPSQEQATCPASPPAAPSPPSTAPCPSSPSLSTISRTSCELVPAPTPVPASSPLSSRLRQHPRRKAMAYAVRYQGQGVVFDELGPARDLFRDLQSQGHRPSMAAGPSLTDAWVAEEYESDRTRWDELERWREESGASGAPISQGWISSDESDESDMDATLGTD